VADESAEHRDAERDAGVSGGVVDRRADSAASASGTST
jgi:hypothetical protein